MRMCEEPYGPTAHARIRDHIEIDFHSQLPTRTKNQKMDVKRSATQNDEEETYEPSPIENPSPKGPKNLPPITENNPTFR